MHSRHPFHPVTAASPYEVRAYRPGDEDAILAAHARAFGARALDRATWEWRYRANPSGASIHVAEERDGTLAAHLGGVRQRMWFRGESSCFARLSDALSDPSRRQGLQRVGVFAVMAKGWGGTHGGQPPEGNAVVWAVPEWPAWRLANKRLRMEVLRTVLKLARPVAGLAHDATAVLGAPDGVAVEEVERFPADVAGLDRRVAGETGAIAVRDAEQLNWRFFDRPGFRYEAAVARRGGAVVGLAVYRRADLDGRAGEGCVVDWLVEPGDPGAASALLGWLEERGGASGAERLVFVVPEYAPEFLGLQRVGFRVERSRMFQAVRCFVRSITARWLYEHWHLTLGDTELV